MAETYTAEEFAQKLKLRGIVGNIKDARDYVKRSGKKEFTEDDFSEAFSRLYTERVLTRDDMIGVFDRITGTVTGSMSRKINVYNWD